MTIVVLSRLVYRKGIDLLVAVIPKICTMLPGVRFLIAGDGPKKVDLEQMRDEHLLHDRVEMFGPVPSEDVRDVLVRGHLFLNTSLTEAFCIAIVEAASCGLLVVSTEVGGVPEVLPSHMLLMAKPEETSLITRIVEAVRLITGREDGFISTNSSPAIRENSISNLSRINPEIFNDNNCRKALESSKRCDQSSIYSISDEIGNSVDQTEIFQSKSLDILFNSNMFTENSCLKKSSMKGGKDGNSQEFSNSNNSNGNRGCSHIIETLSFHEEVSKMYCWEDVAMRTEAVYFQCTHQEGPIRYFDSCESLLRRLAQYYGCGEVFGKIACFIVLIDYALLTILCLLRPQSEIDICPDFDPIKYQQILDEKDG